MRVLFTGGSSLIGKRVLRKMLGSESYSEIWCAQHKKALEISHPKLRIIDLDLTSDANLRDVSPQIDLVVHLAGVIHSRDLETYWKVNHLGTLRLAEAARARGCRRFIYVSTRCATPDAGAYGESKLAAEKELEKLDWESLLIIRPAEIYGAEGKEGIDRFISLARGYHVAPMIFGNPRIEFAPLHIDDFTAIAAEGIANQGPGSVVMEICGPEDLGGPTLAWRLARSFAALPIPIWWPLLLMLLKAGEAIGLHLTAPDQAQRLICRKTSSAKTANARGSVRFLPG